MDLKWKQWSLSALFLLVGVAKADVFDVTNYGATADGKTDISKALIEAWKQSCASVQPSTVHIPKGTYLLGPVVLMGPCKSPSIGFQVEGEVKAPPDLAAFQTDSWIVFQHIRGLTVFGNGALDGQGQEAWAKNNCSQNPQCKKLPVSLTFYFVNNTMIRDITSLNSKFFHMNVFKCFDLNVQHVTISAPKDSPNTDGIHIEASQRINITNINIQTGDDCISIGPGTSNLTVTKVVCGAGHGISVGSLGKNKGESEVNGIFVRNCTLMNTQNGVRIKTWPSSPDYSVASNIVFEDIIMTNVGNPIILDQEYCPHSQCEKGGPSLVKLSNIEYNKIRGTTSSKLVVIIACSKARPCENLRIGDINLQYTGAQGPAQTLCTNAKPIFSGKQIPQINCV